MNRTNETNRPNRRADKLDDMLDALDDFHANNPRAIISRDEILELVKQQIITELILKPELTTANYDEYGQIYVYEIPERKDSDKDKDSDSFGSGKIQLDDGLNFTFKDLKLAEKTKKTNPNSWYAKVKSMGHKLVK